ncbi:hypothetical protein Tco_0325674, partial [Tanacetum coccineum]
RPYALSWKPYQGDSLNLPNHRIHKDGVGDASFQLESDSLPHAHAHAQTTKTYYKHQDSRIMEAQELNDKVFRTSSDTINPVHAYYNGSCTSKDNEDPSWSTSFKTGRTQKTSSALEVLWKTLFVLYLYLIGT